MRSLNNLWKYHANPAQLVGGNRVQLRSLVNLENSGNVFKDAHGEENQDLFLQQVLAKDPDIRRPIMYATLISRSRFPELETRILADVKNFTELSAVARYVKQFFKNGWPELEKILLNSAGTDFLIAYMEQTGLKSWPGLEKRLLNIPEKTPDYTRLKAHYLSKYASASGEPWPEAEPTILKNGLATMMYIFDVLKKPWPAAEHIVVRNEHATIDYLLKFPERTSAINKLT